MTAPDRPIYVLRLRAEPDCLDGIKSLRGLLKMMLRIFGISIDTANRKDNDDVQVKNAH